MTSLKIAQAEKKRSNRENPQTSTQNRVNKSEVEDQIIQIKFREVQKFDDTDSRYDCQNSFVTNFVF